MLVHYLNLARHSVRRERFIRANSPYVSVERFEAVDGAELQERQLIDAGIVAEPLKLFTPRSFGAALSHRALWERCVTGDEPMTIAEDDAILNHQFPLAAPRLLEGLGQNWDIVRWTWNMDSALHIRPIPGLNDCLALFDPKPLGENYPAFQLAEYEPFLLRLIQSFGIACYTISPRGARRLLDACFPLKNEVIDSWPLKRQVLTSCLDVTMNKFYPSMQAYMCFPPLAWTDNE